MLIVVADDEVTSRTLLAATLRKWGHQVECADDGRAALDLITRLTPRVAIVDWMMPGLDGLELCQYVRRDPLRAHTYIILATSRDTKADIVSGLNAGADDYLIKPLDTDELRARLAVATRILESNSESERLLASISSILIGLDADGRITRWNSVAEHTLGVAAPQAIGQALSACGVQWINHDDVEAVARGLLGSASHHEVRFRDARGSERLLGLTVTTMTHGVEGTPGRVVLGAEVTQRRVLEAQLRQAQKLEGIGQLAAGIAHEINTPMQYIGDNVKYLGDSVHALDPLFGTVLELAAATEGEPPAERVKTLIAQLSEQVAAADLEYLRRDLPSAVSQSLEGVDHVSRIVRAMKEFSHPGSGTKDPADLNHAVETTLAVARNELKYVADVTLQLTPDLPRVPCFSGEINQVLLNLFINAAHAIAEVVKNTPGSRGRITVSTHTLDGGIEIRIADTGAGIPEAVQSRIFEPFFTTKDVGKGTGQGLTMAHATIVSRHGGQLWFETTPGTGTTFFIRLPAVAHEADATAA
jgi:PAS domain S-box-containing protein